MEVYFDNRQEKHEVSKEMEELMLKVMEQSLKYENREPNYEISVSFVDNEEIKELNAAYRGKDSATDVLSFPMEEEMEFEGEPKMLGDIIISLERAFEQAKDFGHTFEREVAYLTAHSMLHLMGYDHMEESEKAEMRKKEKDIMKELKIFKS